MTVEELEHKHFTIDEGVVNIPISFVDSHTKLSIQFAIEVLEEVHSIDVDGCGCGEASTLYQAMEDKIQELKQYYDSQI